LSRRPRHHSLARVKLARDTWLVYQRHTRLMLRNRTWLFFGLAQPVTYLVLFAPMLKVALQPMGADSFADAYLIYVPGLLVVMCLYGGLFTGFALLAELRAGIIERCRVTPVSRASLLLGRALREVTSLLVQSTIVVVLAVPLGLRVAIGHLLLAYLLLALVAIMTTTISYYVALVYRNEGGLGPMINTVAQPVALMSGVLLPLALAPLWIQQLSVWNPFAWATHAMRALFRGDLGDAVVWQGVLIIAALSVITVIWTSRRFADTVR
jgi:ABC-2 type transport system permease protein